MTAPVSDGVPGRAGLLARRVRPGVSDAWVVMFCVATATGAYVVVAPGPLGFLASVSLGVVRVRFGLVLLLLFLAGTLATRSLDGLRAELPELVDGRVELVGDPEWVGTALRVDVRSETRRYESWSRGAVARQLADLASGESVEVRGEIDAFDDEWPQRRVRHVAARLDIVSARAPLPATGPVGWANTIRRLTVAGADSLTDRDRVLLTGFTVGDDRGQLPEVTDDFRAAGLTHLTAVSGQNVAFMLLLLAPVMNRLGPIGRTTLTVMVLVQFGLITRWEPSVMRAVAMALAASFGQFFVGKRSPVRNLASVVTVLLLIDPMLVHSLGFRMSVMASLGIALFSRGLATRLRGPTWITGPLALTVAAQVGVAPVLVTSFGSMPLVSIPANMLAGPVSGPLMAWGFLAGPMAGVIGGGAAMLIHLPTRLMTAYLASVARLAAAVPSPQIGVASAVGLLVVGAAVWLLGGRQRYAAMAVALGLVVAASPLSTFDVRGAQLFTDNSTDVLVIDRPSPSRLLAGLRESGVGDIELVVLLSASSTARVAFEAVKARHDVAMTIGPAGGRVSEAFVVRDEMGLDVGPLRITAVPVGGRLVASVIGGVTSP